MLQSEAHIHENSSGGSDDDGSDALYPSAAELSAFDKCMYVQVQGHKW